MATEIVRELVDGEWVTTVGETGGGGSQAEQEVITGSVAAVADQATGLFTLAHDSGDVLLDFTNPLVPTVIADGVYALTAPIAIAGIANTGWGSLSVYFPGVFETRFIGNTAAFPTFVVTLVGQLTAGAEVAINLLNKNGDETTMDGAFNTVAVLTKIA